MGASMSKVILIKRGNKIRYEQMSTFEDLLFKPHSVSLGIAGWKNHKQALIKCRNNRKISIIFGKMFYSNGRDTYELMELGQETADPIGYLTPNEVTKEMIKIQCKRKR